MLEAYRSLKLQQDWQALSFLHTRVDTLAGLENQPNFAFYQAWRISAESLCQHLTEWHNEGLNPYIVDEELICLSCLRGSSDAVDIALSDLERSTELALIEVVLKWASKERHWDLILNLLARPEASNLKNITLITTLTYLAKDGQLGVIDRLLELELDNVQLFLKRNYHTLPFELAASNGHLAVINRFLEFESARDHIADYDNSALRCATKWQHPDVVNRLIEFPKVRQGRLKLSTENSEVHVLIKQGLTRALWADLQIVPGFSAISNLETLSQFTRNFLRNHPDWYNQREASLEPEALASSLESQVLLLNYHGFGNNLSPTLNARCRNRIDDFISLPEGLSYFQDERFAPAREVALTCLNERRRAKTQERGELSEQEAILSSSERQASLTGLMHRKLKP